ncbi:ABC transporter ATP-binding protein [Aeromicrobium camelliae]|uniref:ABC transporter ATP-binding protein n=2 Tax=Aeromicrobium TaxID=2040 RepID=A0A3N6W4G1_9ACTN|nr:ABC transporter ATP-binding protein [Aeromicrobium camelliae]RQN02419.1 ABC transporter ATP-binding protein [Aeromicrobium camelliae]
MRTAASEPAQAGQRHDEQLISIRGATLAYPTASGDPVQALNPIDLDIRAEAFVSLVGPSGCGKSTLLKILAGLLHQSEGEVTLDGRPLTGPSPNVGVVFQQPVLLPWLTILNNVLLPIRVQKRNVDEYRQRAMDLLAMVGLEGFESRYPSELSGGMQQRVGIVRALVPDPQILLMDEPFGALDALTREQLNDDLQTIWAEQRKTVFFITHSIPEAVYLSDRVLVMSERPGRVIADFEVDIPRPRSLEDVSLPEFVELTGRIRRLLNAKGGID